MLWTELRLSRSTVSPQRSFDRLLIKVLVDRPVDDTFRSTHATLSNIICLSLGSDPALIPRCATSFSTPSHNILPPKIFDTGDTEESAPALKPDLDPTSDPDDFVIMSETQAKRIGSMAELAFGVQLSPDVVIADANVGALARRVMGARSLIGGIGRSGG